jgi:hypothetical protein
MIELEHGHLNDQGEYIGNYEGCRVRCKDCKFSCQEIELSESKRKCKHVNLIINENNNVCKQFSPRIINPSHSHEFNFNEYFEWLMNDFYRPYKSSGKIIGSGRLGEAVPDGGRLAELLPNVYSPWYGTVDCLRCTIRTPDCHVHIGKHGFTIDYRKFRDLSFLDGDELSYKIYYYKEKETSRKYTSSYDGKININKLS